MRVSPENAAKAHSIPSGNLQAASHKKKQYAAVAGFILPVAASRQLPDSARVCALANTRWHQRSLPA